MFFIAHNSFHRMLQKAVAEGKYFQGKPLYRQISPSERELFHEAGITVSCDCDAVFYPKLLLEGKNRVIVVEARARQSMRNNSCLSYTTSTSSMCHALLHKLVLVQDQAFAIIDRLTRADTQLSNDTVLNSRIDHVHLVGYKPQRYDIV